MTAQLRPLKIGSIRVPGNLTAAPMAGYTDKITRALAIENGAYLTYTEMISAEALVRKSPRTYDMMERAADEQILAVQLFGASPESLATAAEIAAENGADILDLNVGCPVPKVTKTGAGSALMRHPVLLGRCLAAMKRSGLPLTAKIRLGWDETEINWQEAAHIAVQEGVSALGFHPRTRRQGYGGRSDWDALREAVSSLDIPVIGSGDLFSAQDARDMLQKTSCAGIMFARGAVGNPQIFHETRRLLTKGELPPAVSPKFRLEGAWKHLSKAAEVDGESTASREIKKHLAGYVKGWPSAAQLRYKLMRASNYADMVGILGEAIITIVNHSDIDPRDEKNRSS